MVQKYSKQQKDEWDCFISNSKNGLFIFFRDYMEYHEDRFEDYSLLFYKKNKLTGVLPATRKGTTLISHGGLTFGSLILDRDARAADTLKLFEELLTFLQKEGFTEIIYKSIPFIFHKYTCQEDIYSLFRLNAQNYRTDINSVIYIPNRIKFSESKRQSVSKCKQNKLLNICESDNFSEYWNLLSDVLQKFSVSPTHSLKEMQLLRVRYPNNIKLFELREGKKLLSGIVVYDYGNVVHTQYMANSNEGRALGGLDFLCDYLITDLYNNREYFSFGISNEQNGKILNEGLIQQKEMMGGRGVVHQFYQIVL
ncbi:MAG: GNAT family N-acetyltransferase [Sphingobacteriia bacterium]|nr:GNAT family N-acetyltransferase [Sphingobacteriia bacterium]